MKEDSKASGPPADTYCTVPKCYLFDLSSENISSVKVDAVLGSRVVILKLTKYYILSYGELGDHVRCMIFCNEASG